jgi:hypothetical protein
MAETFERLGRTDCATEVLRRLAARQREAGERADALRLVERALALRSDDRELLALRASLRREHAGLRLVAPEPTAPLEIGEIEVELDEDATAPARDVDTTVDRHAGAGGRDPAFVMAALGLA